MIQCEKTSRAKLNVRFTFLENYEMLKIKASRHILFWLVWNEIGPEVLRWNKQLWQFIWKSLITFIFKSPNHGMAKRKHQSFICTKTANTSLSVSEYVHQTNNNKRDVTKKMKCNGRIWIEQKLRKMYTFFSFWIHYQLLITIVNQTSTWTAFISSTNCCSSLFLFFRFGLPTPCAIRLLFVMCKISTSHSPCQQLLAECLQLFRMSFDPMVTRIA